MRSLMITIAVAHVSLLPSAHAQDDRRDRQDPEIVLNVGGRVATCDALSFSPTGDRLFAVGDDKVVAIWPYHEKKLDQTAFTQRRWPIWREQRGAIYAMDVDAKGERVVIGGIGAKTTTVAVLATNKDEILHLLNPESKGENFHSVRSVAFHPRGDRVAFGTSDGSVWLWDFKEYSRVGKLETAKTDGFNRVRLVDFLDDDHLLAVSESGRVQAWKITGEVQSAGSKLLDNKSTFRMALLSPDKQWLVIGTRGPTVLIRPTVGNRARDVQLQHGEYPRSLAMAPSGKLLAVGIGSLNPRTDFFMEMDDRIDLYDMTKEKPEKIATLPHSYRAEALAFHPKDDILAVAGGDHHELTLWDLSKKEKTSVARGEGACMWDVAISEDGKAIGFRTERDRNSNNINQRARGPWRAFDLGTRSWLPPVKEFKPVGRQESVNGWKVVPDKSDPYKWFVTNPRLREPLALPHDGNLQGEPLCYTFLKPAGADPVRLVVGHYWGISVYELTLAGVKRTQLCTGHQGEVYAVGVSPDHKWAVSAGRDQTITAWSLETNYPSQPILGAKFEVAGDGLNVLAVDDLSPAWEAGLLKGDKVVEFAFGGKFMETNPTAWKKQLENPEPGKEHLFVVEREGKKVKTLTTARQRPLWRFLPAGDEWVLWMWQKPYYDTSTRGDKLIGWHINSAKWEAAPSYQPLERYKKQFHQGGIINKLLQTLNPKEALTLLGPDVPPLRLHEKEPPLVEVVVGKPAGNNRREVVLRATPRGDNPDRQPRVGELWINDHRLERWDDVSKWDREGSSYVRKIQVDEEQLRAGRNVLVFQTYNRLNFRSETTAELASTRAVADRSQLWGVAVGVNDYKAHQAAVQARGGRAIFGNLQSARADAESMNQALKGIQLYAPKVEDPLLDANASRDNILKALKQLRQAKPDDVCILFFAGHGHRTTDANSVDPWFFCCPDYDPLKLDKTAISSEVLYEMLAAIPCRKLVILDACHSGQTAANPIRGLTPGGQGPTIFAACDPSQQSYEDAKIGHGLYTKALLEALTDRKEDADSNKDGVVDSRELFRYSEERLPQLLAASGKSDFLQTPLMFPEDGHQPFGIASAK